MNVDLTEAIEATVAAAKASPQRLWHVLDRKDVTLLVEAAAPVIALAVREQVAREIEAEIWIKEHHGHDGHTIVEQETYRHSAAIARGQQPSTHEPQRGELTCVPQNRPWRS